MHMREKTIKIERFYHVAFRCTDARETVEASRSVLDVDRLGAL